MTPVLWSPTSSPPRQSRLAGRGARGPQKSRMRFRGLSPGKCSAFPRGTGTPAPMARPGSGEGRAGGATSRPPISCCMTMSPTPPWRGGAMAGLRGVGSKRLDIAVVDRRHKHHAADNHNPGRKSLDPLHICPQLCCTIRGRCGYVKRTTHTSFTGVLFDQRPLESLA